MLNSMQTQSERFENMDYKNKMLTFVNSYCYIFDKNVLNMWQNEAIFSIVMKMYFIIQHYDILKVVSF